MAAPNGSDFDAWLLKCLDLPVTAKSPAKMESWQKALNQRNFTDKALRVLQYTMRMTAFSILRTNPKHDLASRMVSTYKSISVSRKAFRLLQMLAHSGTSYDHVKKLIKDHSALDAILAFRWATFSAFLVWDHIFFLSTPSCRIITRWTNAHARKRLVWWRALSDLAGCLAAFIQYKQRHRQLLRLRLRIQSAKTNEGDASRDPDAELAAAESKKREAFYPMIKMVCDVAT
eukprot:TRINITY_DN9381_c0_g1_i1.p1 TRINITY_DN9381_c0_g1~~TRINITY_DN9381_c0_g1_i1.p1  ORF type:complete len:231 (-),score=42.53 TRINITY_DN9381_c0_g1_i1:729-1421(-)